MVSVNNITSGIAGANQINKNGQVTQKSLNQLSSGKSITKVSDNAAGLAISSILQGDVSVLKQAASNIVQGTSLLQTADGGLEQAGNILGRMKELSTQANSGSLDSNARAAINTEYQNLAGELNGLSSQINFNGQKLLDGSFNQSFQTGTDGTTDTVSANLTGVDVSQLGLGMTAAYGANANALSTQASAAATSTELDTAINNLQGYRSQVGSIMSSLSERSDTVQSKISALSESNSAISDADIGRASADLRNSKLLQDLSVATAAQGNKMSASYLKLIR